MLNHTQQLFLDEMTHEERSVFLYHFILKLPQKEIAGHLRMSLNYVNRTVKYFALNIDFLPIKEKLIEGYTLDKEPLL